MFQETQYPETVRPASRPLTDGVWRLDPADPASWSNRRLRYSNHARERMCTRSIPELPYLPETSRLADVTLGDQGVDAVTFKVVDADDPFFLVLSPSGCVITVYRNTAEGSARYASKQRRRPLMTAV